MANKLFIAKTRDGYSLSSSTNQEKEVTYWNQILRTGSIADLICSLTDIPEEFYLAEVKVNWGYEKPIIKIPECEKAAINSFVGSLEKIAFRKYLQSISI